MVDLVRGNRFLLELGSDGRLERSCREHFDIHIAAGIDLVATISACGGDLFRRRAHRNTRRLGGDLRDLVLTDPVFAEKNFVFHKLNPFWVVTSRVAPSSDKRRPLIVIRIATVS